MHPQLTHLLCEERRADLMLRAVRVTAGDGRRRPLRPAPVRLRGLRPARMAGAVRGGHRVATGR